MADLGAAIQKHPDDASRYIDRGNFLLDHARYAEAFTDFDRAATLDRGNEWALADRGMARVYRHQYDLAARDLDAALKIDQKNAVIFRTRGLMAEQKGAPNDAITAYGFVR